MRSPRKDTASTVTMSGVSITTAVNSATGNSCRPTKPSALIVSSSRPRTS